MVDMPKTAWLGTPLRGGEEGQRMVGAVEEARAVEDEQTLGHGDIRL